MIMSGNKHSLGPARRMAGIAPFHVMDILARARAMQAAGRDIVHMEVGEPDFSTPQPIVEAGIESLRQGKTHYTAAKGLPELRQAVADYYQSHYRVSVDPARILITPGASGALQLVLGVLIDPGDKVLMPDPGYPCNRHMVRLFEGEAIELGVKASQDFMLANDQVLRAWDSNCKALMIASPANPTGRLVPLARMRQLLDVVAAAGGALIVDEIYQGLVYSDTRETALALGQDNLFVVNSFSKYFGMTGWRLGWVVAPEAFVPELDRLAQNIFLAAPTNAQYAALAAFQPPAMEILQQRRILFQQRRDYLYKALVELGFRIKGKPEGAFYLYADVSEFTQDSFRFSADLLEQAGVAITPGKDFGSYRQSTHVRFAYTTDMERLQEGVSRIKRWLEQRIS
jgi:aspartate/methionine/tyrosine aminotransferase